MARYVSSAGIELLIDDDNRPAWVRYHENVPEEVVSVFVYKEVGSEWVVRFIDATYDDTHPRMILATIRHV